MEPLRVTAETPDGFCSSDPWSPALDAIVGYWAMYERLGGAEFFSQAARTDLCTPVEGLPFALERAGELWWYACSSPQYVERAVERQYYHRRFDAHDAARFGPAGLGRVQTAAGPYKAARLTVLHRVAAQVTWHVVGDAAEIRRLLSRCTAIGAKVGSGYGRVRRWTVEPGGDPDVARLHRPLPVDYAGTHGVHGAVLEWGIRPPGRLSQNVTLCVMPGEP